ncbi:MAG: hypothetical protein M1824_001823 [Vezdaea acicularis]|nr:MAG: hypothetical protein M1824_001823 [Vezdaea acicularis]
MYISRLLSRPPASGPLIFAPLLRQTSIRVPKRFPPALHTQRRAQSRFPFPSTGGSRPRYTRFSRAQGVASLWQNSPGFRYIVGAVIVGGGVFYVSNIETVPVSGRRRFNVYSPSSEEAIGRAQYQQVLSQYRNALLPPSDPRVRMVRRVLDRLIPSSGLADAKWEVFVIDAPGERNAFVIPGGKVFVFSGILPICNGEDGLAAALGHEIAHNIAHHAAERLSQTILLTGALQLLYLLGLPPELPSALIADLAFLRPGSRKQESEADYIGLMLMAQSCFDPHAAVELWRRMEQATKFEPPQFISTHPSNHNRLQQMREWMPEATAKAAEGECGATLGYANDFKKAFGEVVW